MKLTYNAATSFANKEQNCWTSAVDWAHHICEVSKVLDSNACYHVVMTNSS